MYESTAETSADGVPAVSLRRAAVRNTSDNRALIAAVCTHRRRGRGKTRNRREKRVLTIKKVKK